MSKILKIISLAICLWTCSACTHQPTEPMRIPPIDWHEGDLVFRRGRSVNSHLVVAADTHGHYSHVGIVVWIDSAYNVIHAVPGEAPTDSPDIVKCDPIALFYAPKHAIHGAVTRCKDTLAAQRAAIQAINMYYHHVPFDHRYDWTDSTAVYCTELVWRCYRAAGLELNNDSTCRYLLPSWLLHHNKFYQIVNF